MRSKKKGQGIYCTAWVKGSADQYTRAIWPTENLGWDEKENSRGREYHEGSWKSEDGVAYSAKRKHDVIGGINAAPRIGILEPSSSN